MTGPHALWDGGKPVSPVKRLRVTSGRTLVQAALEAGCSLTALHNLETRGIGSEDLWQRVAASFGVAVAAIKPVTPASRSTVVEPQLVLFGASSS